MLRCRLNHMPDKNCFAISCTIHNHEAHTKDLIANANMSSRHESTLVTIMAKGRENTTTLSRHSAQSSYSFVLRLSSSENQLVSMKRT